MQPQPPGYPQQPYAQPPAANPGQTGGILMLVACLALAVGVHLGIGMCLGMWTFGLAMIIGNLAFVPPDTVRAVVTWLGLPLGKLFASRQTSATQIVRSVPSGA